MTKSIKEIIDELADSFCDNDSEVYTVIKLASESGFDAGVAEMEKRVQMLVEALETVKEAAAKGDGTINELDCYYIADDALEEWRAR